MHLWCTCLNLICGIIMLKNLFLFICVFLYLVLNIDTLLSVISKRLSSGLEFICICWCIWHMFKFELKYVCWIKKWWTRLVYLVWPVPFMSASFLIECGSVKSVQCSLQVGQKYLTITNSNIHILGAPSPIHVHFLNVPCTFKTCFRTSWSETKGVFNIQMPLMSM